jgi:hypothetical protein
MKKLVGIGVVALTAITLAGCSGNSTSSSDKDKATISSLKKENKKLKNINKAYAAALGVDSSSGSSSAKESEQSSSDAYNLGEEGIFGSGSEKQLGLTITAADQNWNAFAQEQGDNIFEGKQANTVQIQVKYRNIAMNESYLPSSDELNVYDQDGNAATPLSYQDGQTEVTEGHTGTTTLWYVFDKPFSEIKKFTIEYAPGDKSLATWEIDK